MESTNDNPVDIVDGLSKEKVKYLKYLRQCVTIIWPWCQTEKRERKNRVPDFACLMILFP